MATFLELVNDVGRESGTMGGQRLTTVDGASGRWAKVVGWTRQAWEIIQRDRGDWTFLRKTFEGALVAGKARYTASDLGIADFGGWLSRNDHRLRFTIHDPAIGRADETRLLMLDYDAWADRFDMGIVPSLRPTDIAYDNERRLCFGQTPDRAYTVRGSYRRAIQRLAANSDTPIIGEDYHQAIVWRALMLLGDDDEAPVEVNSSAINFNAMRQAMLREYTDAVSLA